MKILVAAKSEPGHVNPVTAVASVLIAQGHQVAALTGEPYRRQFERLGARFHPLPADASPDVGHLMVNDPVLNGLPKGTPRPAWFRVAVERALVDPIPLQYAALQAVLRDFQADVIVGESGFMGVYPILLGAGGKRPRVVVCGTYFLTWKRDDGAPYLGGLLPATTEAQCDQYAILAREHDAMFEQPLVRRANELVNALGARSLPRGIFDSFIELADAYLQLSVPGFEFPRSSMPSSVRFVGNLPITPGLHPLPAWSADLDGSRKVVHVTQGTVANKDLGMLIAPTLAALAEESDLLVVVITGGRPLDSIPGPIPSNARVAGFVPYEWLLPRLDVLVTNGGNGGVNQALTFGVPLVTAGTSEEKADVNARVAWSGVGIDLATGQPSPQALRKAVRTVLDESAYRRRAARIAAEFAAVDTRAEILQAVVGD
ncbi:MAG: nucleotide disphospho-sugar-binding domain-containing protein [Paraburkholderia tropica]|uniref:nucleotide disphospho-sugar-binding domain-containing protein n=1 Tax=Burkholderia gladioli TaxID=28095 RepID=UPI00050FD80E|nr:nucleotide disphospho-sugar-binding domain-containing protein [Burkholderia gladioli]AYQ91809.1 glycosyltransferase [Burkholderia gladioli]KGE10815.1 UDP-glucosyltransferase [Burkholderia gladioli]